MTDDVKTIKKSELQLPLRKRHSSSLDSTAQISNHVPSPENEKLKIETEPNYNSVSPLATFESSPKSEVVSITSVENTTTDEGITQNGKRKHEHNEQPEEEEEQHQDDDHVKEDHDSEWRKQPSTNHKAKKKKRDNKSSVPLYCICRRPDIPGLFMIACDSCDEWFHGECVNITPKEAESMKKYVCTECREAREKLQQVKGIELPIMNPNIKCFYKHCNNFSKPNSKYCCDDCGIKAAKELLKEKNEKREQDMYRKKFQSMEQLSAADAEDLKSLEEIQKKKKAVRRSILELEQKEKTLEKAIEFACNLSAGDSPTSSYTMDASDEIDKRSASASLDIMDCVTCGQPIPTRNYARHIEQCFVKKQGAVPFGSSKVNIKENQYQVCGCPTTDFETGYCERLKKNCAKHVNWESLRKSHLLQDKIRQNDLLNSLIAEEKLIQARLTRRGNITGVHRTIEETK